MNHWVFVILTVFGAVNSFADQESRLDKGHLELNIALGVGRSTIAGSSMSVSPAFGYFLRDNLALGILYGYRAGDTLTEADFGIHGSYYINPDPMGSWWVSQGMVYTRGASHAGTKNHISSLTRGGYALMVSERLSFVPFIELRKAFLGEFEYVSWRTDIKGLITLTY